jgi:hypothetical protein
MSSNRCVRYSIALVLCFSYSLVGSSLIAMAQSPAAPAGTQDTESADANAKAPAARTLKELPSGVAPNPPRVEDLTTSGMTWKGEYEADNDGKPVLGPDARPLPVLYNKKGKRVKSKIKLPKTHPINIAAGTMTVDGWTGKARLNYDIPDLRYIYLSVPNIGTAVVSQSAFPGSTEQKEAFHENMLTVLAGGHQLELASDKTLLGKKPVSAWVRFDSAYTEDARYPVMGYGSAANAPYEWPGAKNAKTATGAAEAPPLPVSMRPKLATAVCITNCAPKAIPAPVAAAPASSTR